MAAFQASNVCLCDLRVVAEAEDQRHIDVDTGSNRFFYRRDTRVCRRNFDHGVGAVHRLEEAFRFFHRRLGVVGDERGNFQTYVPITSIGAVINRTEDVERVLNVFNRQILEDDVGFFFE